MTPLISHPDAFPATPPPDLDDPVVIAAHEWQAFDELVQMQDHWQRPGWTAETRAYYWLITFPDDHAFVAHALRSQALVRDLGVFDLIGAGDFHLTLGRIGRTDEVKDDQLKQLTKAVQAAAPHTFKLSALPLTGSRGALRYSVAPWTPVIALHQILVETAARCGLPPMKSTSRLRPHIGIGYCHTAGPAGPVHAAVKPLRLLPPTELLIDRIELVEMRRERASYKWRVIQTVRLPRALGVALA